MGQPSWSFTICLCINHKTQIHPQPPGQYLPFLLEPNLQPVINIYSMDYKRFAIWLLPLCIGSWNAETISYTHYYHCNDPLMGQLITLSHPNCKRKPWILGQPPPPPLSHLDLDLKPVNDITSCLYMIH